MKIIMKHRIGIIVVAIFMMLSINTNAQLQIVASGPTDVCIPNAPILSVVNPPANYTFEWFVVVGNCFNHTSVVIGNSSSIQANGTSGYFCVGTDPNGNQQISNTIFVRVLPGSIGSMMLPSPYSSNQVACLSSIDLCIPVEMAPPGFSTTIKWYRNNVHIAGVTTPFYTATLGGFYKYSISNACATSFSDSVEYITSSSVPQFTTAAVSPICNGNTISFSATNPIPGATYTWQTSNFPTSGFVASGSGVNFSYIVPSALNLYVRLQCVFTGCGVQISPAVGYTIQNISRQISPFATQSICSGSSVNLTINISGGSATLQWLKNGVPIAGATGTSYAAATAGVYSVAVTASCGVSYSNNVTVVVNNAPVASITPPTSTTFCAGSSVTLQANTGAGLTYVWKKYGNVIAGATSSSYVATGSGIYKVVVSNSSGCSTNSSNITLTALPLPTATISAAGSTAICPGTSVTLNANTGTGLTYQWRKYSNVIVGATGSTYAATGAGQYKVRVTNANGCAKNSNTINVTTLPAPTAAITAIGPTTFCQGDSVRLAANTGAGLSYQWKKGSNNISGATTANYYAKVAGNFKVTVTGSNGCVKNSNAIAVNVPCRVGAHSELANENSIRVFPNPSSDKFYLEINESFDEPLIIKAFDSIGKELNVQIIKITEGSFEFEFEKPGMYIITISSSEFYQSIKVLKTS